MKFHDFRTAYDSQNNGESASEFYESAAALLRRRGTWTPDHQLQMDLEYQFIRSRRPYFKIHPSIGWCMAETAIDIEARHIPVAAMPVFEVRLPQGKHNPLATGGECICSAIVGFGCQSKVRDPSGRVIDSDCVATLIYFRGRGDQKRFDIPLDTGDSIASQLARWGDIARHDDAVTPAALRSALVSIAICTLFFAADKHELVMPDIARREVQCGKSNRNKSEPRVFGWTIGREVDLPRPHYLSSASESSGDGSRELHHSHIRRGHMKMQPCGVGGEQRKLIFVSPTVVRPDLPAKQQGYRIRA